MNFFGRNLNHNKKEIIDPATPNKNDNITKLITDVSIVSVAVVEINKEVVMGIEAADRAVPKIISNCRLLNSIFKIKKTNSNTIPAINNVITLSHPVGPIFELLNVRNAPIKQNNITDPAFFIK